MLRFFFEFFLMFFLIFNNSGSIDTLLWPLLSQWLTNPPSKTFENGENEKFYWKKINFFNGFLELSVIYRKAMIDWRQKRSSIKEVQNYLIGKTTQKKTVHNK